MRFYHIIKASRIMTLENTIEHYLNTIHSHSPGITCPACGSILGIRRQGSTEMILTENTRLELDGYLASYRRFLEKLELLLEQQNVHYKAYPGTYPYTRELTHYRGSNESVEFNRGGVYTGIVAKPVVDKLVEELDFFEWIDSFTAFSRRLEQPEVSPQDMEDMFRAKDKLLGGLEPRSIAGPLMDLIFDQTYVAGWREKILKFVAPETFDALLDDICPAIQWFLRFLRDINQQSSSGRLPFSQKNQPDPSLAEGIIRVQFILAILLGHRSQKEQGIATFLTEIGITPGVPFTLPRKTVVSPKYLQELLRSEPVLGNPRIGLSQDLLQKLKQDTTANAAGNGTPIPLEEIFTMLRKEIHQFVHFTCTGPAGDQPNAEPKADQFSSAAFEYPSIAEPKQNNSTRAASEETCGWYPKPEPTHSVILLGSPGTGKSSVMLTGFTTFYDNIFALGATISFDSPEDEVRMKRLNEDYWAGKMPSPTAKGSRTTIKLAVDFPEQGYPRTNYVFTDIAGEVMARSLTHEGSDPAVLRILKNAETIVFFFDISIEPSIRKKLTEGDDDGTWNVVEENFARVWKSRIVKKADGSETEESSAAVSQLQLLKRLIRDLQVQRGTEDLKSADLNFICVIPKLDLFISETKSDRYFFSGMIKELKDQDILVRSNRNKGDESFTGLRSLGGILAKLSANGDRGSNGNGGSSNSSNSVALQKQIAQWMSERTLHHLGKIGDALSTDTAAPIRASLRKTLEVGLIATLHQVFGKEKVYFLPVSAQGKNSEQLNLGNPPNQKLSEYVFILPVILSVNAAKTAPSTVKPGQEPSFPFPGSWNRR
jgi:hypothetical protein